MPYLQPATNNYFGFMPAQDVTGIAAKTGLYLVSSSEGNDIMPGDVVVYATHTSGSGIRRKTGSTSTDLGVTVGVAASVLVAGNGSSGASLRALTSQNVLVYDSPYQIFVGCDTTSGVIGGGALGGGVVMGKFVGVVSTGVIGSTGPSSMLQRSVMAVSAVTASSAGCFVVLGLHPCESGLSTVAAGTAASSGEVRKWILQIANHYALPTGVGGHVTT